MVSMNKTKYTIYWTGQDGLPHSMKRYDLTKALAEMEKMRKRADYYHSIAYCAENVDQVGQMGVDAVVDGKLPDGQDYVYKTGRDRGRDPR